MIHRISEKANIDIETVQSAMSMASMGTVENAVEDAVVFVTEEKIKDDCVGSLAALYVTIEGIAERLEGRFGAKDVYLALSMVVDQHRKEKDENKSGT